MNNKTVGIILIILAVALVVFGAFAPKGGAGLFIICVMLASFGLCKLDENE
jgi:membrane-bound ClpP family serine protease